MLVKKIEAHFGGSLKGKTIAVWGLAFKPKTDDMREAPAIPIIEALLAKGAKIQAYDPEAMKVAKGIFGNKITYAAKNYDALKGADALAVVTEWQEFREPDFARIKKLMRAPVIFDGRNIYQREQMKTLGFTYFSIVNGSDELARRRRSVMSSRTGGAGYIGSHAVRALVDAGHAVAVLDDLSAGHAESLPTGVPLVKAAIHDRDAVHRAARRASRRRGDAFCGVAQGRRVGRRSRSSITRTTSSGTLAVLAAMRDAGVTRFIFSSTCAVYGEPRVGADRRDARHASDQRLRRDRS